MKSEESHQPFSLKNLKIFGKFLENHLQQRILKAHNYAEYETFADAFLRIS